jgi:hypothetical protein
MKQSLFARHAEDSFDALVSNAETSRSKPFMVVLPRS